MRPLAAIAGVLTVLLVAAPAALPQSSLKVERRVALEAAVVREVNRVRATHGLRPLRAAPSLRAAARGHSLSMLELGYFGHDSADGTAFSDRIKRHYSSRGWRAWSVGEALLASQGKTVDAPAIVAAWLASPPHRDIILSPTWRDAGIGALYAPTAPREYGGAETIVVTADFGMREGKTELALSQLP
jgi:uncharacterized protein YkwD